MDSIKNRAFEKAASRLAEYKSELLKERERQTEIKERYGLKSLECHIFKLGEELIDLERRKERGENVDLVIRNKEERKKEYEKALEELKELIKREKSLTMTTPRYIGIIRIKPYEVDSHNMKSDAEIEAIGMTVAMEYEKREGRIPDDVSSQNLGFDIRSRDNGGKTRYIEVKARAEMGTIALTPNEWFKAQRFKDDYYLYVVYNASTKPELYIIQNPAKNLKTEEEAKIVRYMVKADEIREKRENVWMIKGL